MSNADAPTDGPRTGSCTIHVDGHLGERWLAWFDEFSVIPEDDGTTVIHGPVADQAALLGLLQTLRDADLPLISVVRTDPTTLHRPPTPHQHLERHDHG
jgi:hypothetical protein